MVGLMEHQGFKQVLNPYLLSKLNQSFPDPAAFNKEEEFIYAAKVSSVFKKVIVEILSWVETQVDEAKYLQKKEKGEIVETFQIGK